MESRPRISQYFVQQSAPPVQEEEDTEAVWVRREAARMRQIAIGKARPEYRRYLAEVPVNLREPVHPSTPNPKDRVSKRQFDRALGDWRRRLHEFDAELGFDDTRPPSSDGPVQPGAMSRTPTQTSGLGGESSLSLPRHAVPPPKSPPRPQEKSSMVTIPQVSPSLVPQHPPPSQPPLMDGGVVQLHLADQLPAPVPQAQGPAPMQAHPDPPQVDLASAAAIGVAAAMTAIFRGQCPPCGGCAPPPSWTCEMPCDPNMMYVPHPMEPAATMMCDAASSSFMAQPMMNVAPETPLRGRQMPMDDGETPPPVCPFWTQANSEANFIPFQKAVLGAVTEECERGTKLTYEDAMSPCSGNRNHLSVPKEPMTPMTPMTPQRETRRVACSPSSVVQTPAPGWVVETPSPNSWLSRNMDFAPYPSW